MEISRFATQKGVQRIATIAIAIGVFTNCGEGGCELSSLSNADDPLNGAGAESGTGAGKGSGSGAATTIDTSTFGDCIDYATVIQPIFDDGCTHCHTAPDPPRNLILESYDDVMKGGLTGNEIVGCSSDASYLFKKISMTKPPKGDRMPQDGPPYLDDTHIATIQKWIDLGAPKSCPTDPSICNDEVPPTFAGLTKVDVVNAVSVEICWEPGDDNLTAAEDIVYDVYDSAAPGGQLFGPSPGESSDPGATCVTVNALSPEATYCFVVRARDGSGNRDQNVVEECVVMPSVPAGCLDYNDFVAPLLAKHCAGCHSGNSPPKWLRLDSYEGLLVGGARRYELVACIPSISLLIQKISKNPSFGKRMPRDGPPYLSDAQIAMLSQWITNGGTRTCAETSPCGDKSGPTWSSGVATATAVDSTTVKVCWPAATDTTTNSKWMRYDIYEATSGQTPATVGKASQHTVVDASCLDVEVGAKTTICFDVRARDLDGRVSSMLDRVCVTTKANSCSVDYDTQIQPLLTARCSYCHRGLEAGHYLNLQSYGRLLAGGSLRREVVGCDWNASLINTKTRYSTCGQRMPRDGWPWLSISERSRLKSWIDSGARRSCSDPDPCSDNIAPTFSGIDTATATNATTIKLCWNAAKDGTTPSSSITYLIYESSSPGNQIFYRPASYAAPAGDTCIDIPTRTDQKSCYVVRARDLRGNTDNNNLEKCATTPAGCFAYDDMIQGIFNARCVHCHSGSNPPKGVSWASYADAVADSGEVKPCKADGSKMIDKIESCVMPIDTTEWCGIDTACLAPSQQGLLRQWVDSGANKSCPWGGCQP